MSDCGLTGITFKQPSLVRPQFAADSDLSTIVRRFLKDGTLPDSRPASPITDAIGLPQSFQELMDQNRSIVEQFDMLPLEERQKYNNSCENWLVSLAEKSEKETVENKKIEDQPVDLAVDDSSSPKPGEGAV